MIDVYYTPGSPACRFVLLVTAALAIPINRIFVDLKKDEQLHPEFLQINPQHSVPTIVDNGYVLWESRAIARYLVNQYSDSCELYPLDTRERGLVDQRLDFDLGTLCPAFSQYFYPQLFSGSPPTEALKKKVEEATRILDTFLEGNEFVAGGLNMTIADLSLVTTVSTMDAIGFKLEPYPNIIRWFEVIKSTAPGYEKYNEAGLQEFRKLVDDVSKAREQVANEKRSHNQVSQLHEKKSHGQGKLPGSTSQKSNQSKANSVSDKSQNQMAKPTQPDQTKHNQNKASLIIHTSETQFIKPSASVELRNIQNKAIPPKDMPETQSVKLIASDLQRNIKNKPNNTDVNKSQHQVAISKASVAKNQDVQVVQGVKPTHGSMLFKDSKPEMYVESNVIPAITKETTSESKVIPVSEPTKVGIPASEVPTSDSKVTPATTKSATFESSVTPVPEPTKVEIPVSEVPMQEAPTKVLTSEYNVSQAFIKMLTSESKVTPESESKVTAAPTKLPTSGSKVTPESESKVTPAPTKMVTSEAKVAAVTSSKTTKVITESLLNN